MKLFLVQHLVNYMGAGLNCNSVKTNLLEAPPQQDLGRMSFRVCNENHGINMLRVYSRSQGFTLRSASPLCWALCMVCTVCHSVYLCHTNAWLLWKHYFLGKFSTITFFRVSIARCVYVYACNHSAWEGWGRKILYPEFKAVLSDVAKFCF